MLTESDPLHAEPQPATAEQKATAERLLVERARRGDDRAFASLYARFAPVVHGVLLSCAPRDAVDDLMQDAFVAAWRGLESLRDAEQFGPWLLTIARNGARRRHARARPAGSLESEPADRAPLGPDAAGEILETLRSLPATYRETLVLRLVEGLTGPEIAAATGLTHGSVRVNLTRGMKLLREALERRGLE